MSSRDRFPYLTATAITQDFLDNCHDNLTNNLELAVTIETPTGYIYASNRNKYVGSTFYEALLNVPTVTRTVGQWLSGELQFSSLELELSNVDGRFNEFLPSGANYGGWIDKTVEVSLGLRDVSSTYKKIFEGIITEVGGVGRSVKAIKIIARDKFQKLNDSFPQTVFDDTTFPNIEENKKGQYVPVIYGDWTTAITANGASARVFVVNGADTNVIGGTRNNVQVVISQNANSSFNAADVFVLRASKWYNFAAVDIVNINANNNQFEIVQNSGSTTIEGSNYLFEQGDEYFVKVKGKTLGGGTYDDNIVEQARDILLTYGNAVAGDFDSNWDTFRDKATPSESAISTFKSRVYQQESVEAMTFALSLLEEVRLEAFISRDQLIKINSLHFDDYVASPSFTVRNWDVVKDSFSLNIDTLNNFNRAQAAYNKLPDLGEEAFQTGIWRNQAAINQSRAISKLIVFPHLYEEATVIAQLKEIIKLASASFEIVDVQLTWRSMLLDIGDFVKLDVKIESTEFDESPAMIRDIGVDPVGLKIIARMFSFQMVPFSGYSPGYSGIVGGSTATITEE